MRRTALIALIGVLLLPGTLLAQTGPKLRRSKAPHRRAPLRLLLAPSLASSISSARKSERRNGRPPDLTRWTPITMVSSIAPKDALGVTNMRIAPLHRQPSLQHNNPTAGSRDSR